METFRKNIQESLKKKRPNLTASSLKTYVSILANISKKLDPKNEDIDIFDKHEEILETRNPILLKKCFASFQKSKNSFLNGRKKNSQFFLSPDEKGSSFECFFGKIFATHCCLQFAFNDFQPEQESQKRENLRFKIKPNHLSEFYFSFSLPTNKNETKKFLKKVF